MGCVPKIILGKLLLEEADVLLLDEPTNFLDVRHIEWLAKFLQSYPKAFLVVSHHEEFLDQIATTCTCPRKMVSFQGIEGIISFI